MLLFTAKMFNCNQVLPYIQDHYGLIILSVIIIYLIHFIYQIFQPFDNYFMCHDPDHGPAPEVYVKHRLGALPAIHPYGWSPILESRDLKKRQVLSVGMYDEDLVVYRDGSGEVHVFDAFCPHLGANIGIGGTVEGNDRLRCPFHSWTFNSDGQCVDVPGLDKDNLPKASLKKWPSAEKSQMIWIWRHPDEPEPKWPCINMPNVDEEKLTCLGRSEFNMMMAVQDYGENTFDYHHFDTLHSDIQSLTNFPLQTGFWVGLWRRIIRIKWDFSHFGLKPCHDFETPLLLGDLPRGVFYLMGVQLPGDIITMTVEITNPYSFFYRYVAPGVSIMFHACLLPVPGGKLKFVERYYMQEHSFTTRLMARYSMPYLTNLLIQQDSPIWQNRLYRSKPHLTKLDHGVVGWRRWLSQFYAKTKTVELSNDKIAKDI